MYLGDSTMDVFGSVNITNNKNNGTNSNVYLTDGKTMTVDNDFDGKIGVTAEKPVEELVVATGTSLTGNVVTKFQSDDVKYGIKLSGNDLVLTGKTDVTNKITFPSGQLTYTGSGLRYEKATISEGYNGKFTYTYWVPKGGSTGELDANGLPLAVGTYTVTPPMRTMTTTAPPAPSWRWWLGPTTIILPPPAAEEAGGPAIL